MNLVQARADVDAKRTKLAKLRGTAGIKVSVVFVQLDLRKHTSQSHESCELLTGSTYAVAGRKGS